MALSKIASPLCVQEDSGTMANFRNFRLKIPGLPSTLNVAAILLQFQKIENIIKVQEICDFCQLEFLTLEPNYDHYTAQRCKMANSRPAGMWQGI